VNRAHLHRAHLNRTRLGCLACLLLVGVTAACGIPSNGTPTAIAKADVPFHLLNPAPSTTTPHADEPVPTQLERIYLVASGNQVVPVERRVRTPVTLTEVLATLLDGPTTLESRFGLQTFLSGSSTKVAADVTKGIATVDFFSANPLQVVGPDQTVAIAQVVFTATEQPGVAGVRFEINGKSIEVPTANGAQVPGPVTRADYQPQAPKT
jgi:spore germination protein GerM